MKDVKLKEFIAERLRERRAALHVDQDVIAERAQITQQSLSRYENAEVEPKAGALFRLARALHVDPSYFDPATQEQVALPKAQAKRRYVNAVYLHGRELVKIDWKFGAVV